jgi:thiol-disulfide isomerase/thioredoxin
MKGLLLSLLSCFVFSGALLVSIPKVDPPSLSTDGIVVVEFNAAFNKQNSVDWIEKLNDCVTDRVDIATSPQLQAEFKIVVVPTIIVFNEGEEVKRFQANIMMQIDANRDDVQDAVDEIIMSDF